MSTSPAWLRRLIARYDPAVVEAPERALGVRLVAPDGRAWEVVLAENAARIQSLAGRPDAVITADIATWGRIAAGSRDAVDAYLAGELSVRNNLHVGVGFLAATSGARGPTRLRFRSVATPRARLSVVEAGEGPPVVAMHGLGATKGRFCRRSRRYRIDSIRSRSTCRASAIPANRSALRMTHDSLPPRASTCLTRSSWIAQI